MCVRILTALGGAVGRQGGRATGARRAAPAAAASAPGPRSGRPPRIRSASGIDHKYVTNRPTYTQGESRTYVPSELTVRVTSELILGVTL